jgi:hypothetical protein
LEGSEDKQLLSTFENAALSSRIESQTPHALWRVAAASLKEVAEKSG